MFEGFSDLYQEISVGEYHLGKGGNEVEFSKLDRIVLPELFKNFISGFNSIGVFQIEAFRAYVESRYKTDIIKYIYFTIWKTDDDWYWVRYDNQDPLEKGKGVKFFKCDQLDGVRKLITDNPKMLVPRKH